MNASPDLPVQIEAFSELQPGENTLRNSPIAGVFLTNADLDHCLGLFLLREGRQITVFGTGSVRNALSDGLKMVGVLELFSGLDWKTPTTNFEKLETKDDKSAGIEFRMIPLAAGPPLYAKAIREEGPHSVAYEFLDRRTGGRLVVAPDVGVMSRELSEAVEAADAVLFDGTFWSEDELKQINPEARTSTEMGHLTIRDGSLSLLSASKARHKFYMHINNTNPVLAPRSPERAAVESAGVSVGTDGIEFQV